MTELLLTENRGPVRILTMNRPEKLNAINSALSEALTAALRAAQADDSVATLVLTGAGRAFCAGADTSQFTAMTGENRRHRIAHGDAGVVLNSLIGRIDKPVVAAVKGYALGAGAALAIGSDLVVAGESARFGYPELKIGVAATAVGAHLAHRLGAKAAFELLALCENIGPERAMALGLVNRVVPDAEVLDTAVGLADTMASFNHDALWQTKRVFQRALALTPEQALEMARDTGVMMAKLSA